MEESGKFHIPVSPAEKALGTHRIGGWMASTVSLNVSVKRNSCPYQVSNANCTAYLTYLPVFFISTSLFSVNF
jgi:hypothetical protein